MLKFIQLLHRPFARFIPEQIFRYGLCGGGNMVLDWVLYFLIYNFVVGHELVQIPGLNLVITPHILALGIVFPITLMTGFLLNKYITFTQSSLRTRTQLFRYILIVAVNLLINYLGLKLCVELLGWYPTPSKMFITFVTIIISFLGQKYFTFAK